MSPEVRPWITYQTKSLERAEMEPYPNLLINKIGISAVYKKKNNANIDETSKMTYSEISTASISC